MLSLEIKLGEIDGGAEVSLHFCRLNIPEIGSDEGKLYGTSCRWRVNTPCYVMIYSCMSCQGMAQAGARSTLNLPSQPPLRGRGSLSAFCHLKFSCSQQLRSKKDPRNASVEDAGGSAAEMEFCARRLWGATRIYFAPHLYCFPPSLSALEVLRRWIWWWVWGFGICAE